jgi:hypothetical protein
MPSRKCSDVARFGKEMKNMNEKKKGIKSRPDDDGVAGQAKVRYH